MLQNHFKKVARKIPKLPIKGKMTLIDDIRSDLKHSMLQRDTLRTSTLRLLIAAIKNKEIEKGENLNDDELLGVLSTEVKKRRESVEEYEKAGRQELADKESAEIDIIQGYMPEQLSDEELANIINEVITETGAEEKKDMGKVMSQLMPKVRGKADGRKVSQMVNQKLGG